jgi:hypothetical protein
MTRNNERGWLKATKKGLVSENNYNKYAEKVEANAAFNKR